jgi:nickel-type superoxide dismutase maturation protease
VRRLIELVEGRLLRFVVLRLSVDGNSMAPTYVRGERLTAVRQWRPIRRGDVVVVRDPRDPERWLLKRCVARSGSTLDLRGDNPDASTDSREFGPVPASAVAWIVVGGRPPGRRRVG